MSRSATVSLRNSATRFAKSYPTFIAELHTKRALPGVIELPRGHGALLLHRQCGVEAVNGQLEIMRRNSGGYFHSEDTLKFKLGLAITSDEVCQPP
jgi:hypothetical protein